MEREKSIDESWKETAGQDKVDQTQPTEPNAEGETAGEEVMEVNFVNYVTSMTFQAIIFMGEIPNPITNEIDKNLKQAKFIIDTLVMMKEKTQGNLSQQEADLLNGTLYELQTKFIEHAQKEQETQ